MNKQTRRAILMYRHPKSPTLTDRKIDQNNRHREEAHIWGGLAYRR